MIKLLWGGSPCTYWSIAQKNNRETRAEGTGWELFKNFLLAKEKFHPDFFLYENNKSAAEPIKAQIRQELGGHYIEINSALVSAQNRQRFYVHNGETVEQPEDRGIMLADIFDVGFTDRDKAYCLKHQAGNIRDYFKKHHSNIAYEPVRVGSTPCPNGEPSEAQSARVYSLDGKSTTLAANGGGGAKTGLYAIPVNDTNGKSRTIKHQYQNSAIANFITNGKHQATGIAESLSYAIATAFDKYGLPTQAVSPSDGKLYTVYPVFNERITIKEKEYPAKLPNGFYIIRKLTVKECCRLQTLPDDYCRAVSDTQAYKGLGNGWTAEVIIHLLSGMMKGIPRDEKLLVLSMYDGIGTGRYCLDKMGFSDVEYHAYEIDKYAMSISASNYPDIIQHGDAFQIRNTDWKLN